MKPRDRARKVIDEMNSAPLILPENVSFSDWLEDNLTRAIEEAETSVRSECLEYVGMADWD